MRDGKFKVPSLRFKVGDAERDVSGARNTRKGEKFWVRMEKRGALVLAGGMGGFLNHGKH
jgi:hypothetical protein